MALTGGNVAFTGYQQPNYSGVVESAGLPMQAISQGITQAQDYFKQQGEKNKLIKKSDVQIDAALKLFPDLAPSLQGVRDHLKDQNVPLDDRASIAESIPGLINMGIGQVQNASNLALEQRKAMMEGQYKNAQLGLEARKVSATEATVKQGNAPNYQFKTFEVIDPNGNIFKKDMPYNPKTGRAVDTESGREILDVQKWFEGQDSYANPSTGQTSQNPNSLSDSIAAAANMSVGKLSTKDTPGTEGGKVGCADAVCRIFKQATGEEIVPGGTLSTSEMSSSLQNDSRFVKVPLDEATKGDIVLTPRGKTAGHTGIVVDGGQIVSNSSSGFKGGEPGTVAKNYSVDSWIKSIAPRNPSETAAYRYVGSKGIDNALSMNADISQQAMGTPEQQAEIARLINQGQNSSIAQNQSATSVPTEQSVIGQQTQNKTFTPRSGFVPLNKQVSSEEQRLQDLKIQNEELSIAQKKQEGAKALGDEVAAKQAAIDEKNASISAIENTYKQLVEAKNSPGIKGAFGIPVFRVIPGTDESVARVSVDQIAANAWLNSIIDARNKGARFGSLSNSEGERLAVATSKLAQASNLSYEAGNKEIQNMIESLKTSYKRLSGKELTMPEAQKAPASRIGLAQDNFNNANFGIRTY